MSDDITRMRQMLEAAVAGAQVRGDRGIAYDEGGLFFSVGDSGIEVALEQTSSGDLWRVREVFDIADTVNGGFRTVAGTVSVHHVGDELAVSKSAVMKMIERRIDSALDAVG
jgi:hypothetical protein